MIRILVILDRGAEALQTLSVTYAAPNLGETANIVFDVTGYFAL